ncbi:MAG: hypothetical protein M3680_32885 [Myxococcota bacterium]|nr:hypothetical protein [Myxococcota bacterium]
MTITRGWVTAALVMTVLTARAQADVLVLRAEGRADKQAHAKIEASVLALAKATGTPTTRGDITFSDAAAAVGCSPDAPTCSDEVLGMLAVDEVVTISTTPRPGGLEVHVRRVAKGGVTRTATMLVPPDQTDRLDGIAPLFGGTPAAAGVAPGQPAPRPAPAISTAPPTLPETPSSAVPPATTIEEPTPSVVSTAAASGPLDERPPGGNRRLQLMGMAGGGTLLLLGLIFWGSAASVADEAESAPNRTRVDLENLQDLEQKGDDYASTGNVLALTGAILGGISTYYFVKGNRARRAHAARITPAVLGDGAGIAITFGGAP